MTKLVFETANLRAGTVLQSPYTEAYYVVEANTYHRDGLVSVYLLQGCTTLADMNRLDPTGWCIPSLEDVPEVALEAHAKWFFENGHKYQHLHETCIRAVPMTVRDTGQVGGDHYAKLPEGYEPFDIAMQTGMNALEFTVLKYIMRHESKGGKQDLLKAQDALNKLILRCYP